MEKLRKSRIVEDIEKSYDFPIVVLFGSYATATDTLDSDIDICVISNIEKEFSLEKYEKILNRKVSLHKFSKHSFDKAKKLNKGLVNNVCKGILLSGELEVL